MAAFGINHQARRQLVVLLPILEILVSIAEVIDVFFAVLRLHAEQRQGYRSRIAARKGHRQHGHVRRVVSAQLADRIRDLPDLLGVIALRVKRQLAGGNLPHRILGSTFGQGGRVAHRGADEIIQVFSGKRHRLIVQRVGRVRLPEVPLRQRTDDGLVGERIVRRLPQIMALIFFRGERAGRDAGMIDDKIPHSREGLTGHRGALAKQQRLTFLGGEDLLHPINRLLPVGRVFRHHDLGHRSSHDRASLRVARAFESFGRDGRILAECRQGHRVLIGRARE